MENKLGVREAAKRLGYHPHHLYRLLRNGTVKGAHFGRMWIIDSEEIRRIKALQDENGRLPRGL